jgi:prolyl oligopeptidase PreP (S9A serine peptidase family)
MVRHKRPEQTNTGMARGTDLSGSKLMMHKYDIHLTNPHTHKNVSNYQKICEERLNNSFFEINFEDLNLNKINCSSENIDEENESYFNDISCCSGDSYQQNEGDLIPIEDLNDQIMEMSNMELLQNDFEDDYIESEESSQFSVENSFSNHSVILDNEDYYSTEEEIPETILSSEFLKEIEPQKLTSLQQINKIEKKAIESEDEDLNDLIQTIESLEIKPKQQIKTFMNQIVESSDQSEDEDININLGKHSFFNSNDTVKNSKTLYKLKKIKENELGKSSWSYHKMIEPYRHLKDPFYNKLKQR